MRLSTIGIITLALIAVVMSLWPIEWYLLALMCLILLFAVLGILLFSSSRAQLCIGTLAAVFLISIATTNWPLRVAYSVSRPSFDRVASQIRAGEAITTPCFVGMFRIQKAEINYTNTVCLWTDDDLAGHTGFVQCSPVAPPFNLWGHTGLDDSWQFITED